MKCNNIMKVLIMCLVRTQSQGRFLEEAIFHPGPEGEKEFGSEDGEN